MTGAALLAMRFALADLPMLRSRVGEAVRLAGLDQRRCEEFVLAAYELAGNAIRHGGGGGSLRLFCADGFLRCLVSDDGPGFAGPADSPGSGLWLARQLADGLEIDSGAGGAVVTLSVLCRSDSRLTG